jgi:hypothetical protein
VKPLLVTQLDKLVTETPPERRTNQSAPERRTNQSASKPVVILTLNLFDHDTKKILKVQFYI